MTATEWVLPEDGITDMIAVTAAAFGSRPVRLTPREQRIAARLIAEACAADAFSRRRRPPLQLICQRLHVSVPQARALLAPECDDTSTVPGRPAVSGGRPRKAS